jgi:hypothetical protein
MVGAQVAPTKQNMQTTPNHKDACHPSAKWGAVIDDSPYSLPRAVSTARDILDQIGASPTVALKRDYNSGHDQIFADDEMVDLREGNVFKIVPKCDPVACRDPNAKPKLAFILDVADSWEITVNPNQTGKSLKRLLGIADDSILLLDMESPHDVPVGDEESVIFADGPVFIAKRFHLTIKVNNKPVEMARRKATVLEIKQAAIAQGVKIEIGFILFQLDSEGNLGPALPDDKILEINDCDGFRCVAPDDNS